jgi:hypothetical protein
MLSHNRHDTLKQGTDRSCVTNYITLMRRVDLKLINDNDKYHTHGAEPFLRSRQLCSCSRTCQHFMEPEGSLSCSLVHILSQIDPIHYHTCKMFDVHIEGEVWIRSFVSRQGLVTDSCEYGNEHSSVPTVRKEYTLRVFETQLLKNKTERERKEAKQEAAQKSILRSFIICILIWWSDQRECAG